MGLAFCLKIFHPHCDCGPKVKCENHSSLRFLSCISEFRRLLLTFQLSSSVFFQAGLQKDEDELRSECWNCTWTSWHGYSCWAFNRHTQWWMGARRPQSATQITPIRPNCLNEWLRLKMQTFLLLLQLKQINLWSLKISQLRRVLFQRRKKQQMRQGKSTLHTRIFILFSSPPPF